ncbi:MAG: hypothetical protein RMJ28_07360 [Nitrososphaerota archaeon]|nr:hypothetical protein [Candidatus Calditenuaceae archaeon]MDW8074030.1 hypothetical protein [Nitrososphaerota archaeon]
MAVVSFRIGEELKRRMARLRHINWSEVVRRAIAERVELEERLGASRRIDSGQMREALEDMDRLRAKTSGVWSGSEEVRRWRESRRPSSTPR